MKNNVERIKGWLEKNSKQTLSHLNGPAPENEIVKVEAEIGLSLPDTFKEFLRTHDGEDGKTWLALFGDGNQLLPCHAIVEQYTLDQQIGTGLYDPEMHIVAFWKDRVESKVIFIKGPVKPLMLHPKWIPITCMNGDVFRYIDLDPAPGGISGQIIEVDPEGCSYQVLASSFGELMELYFAQLLSGGYDVDDEGYIETKKENEMNWGVPEWLKNA
ncbi:MAG: SMI1/KNR4 family protein [Methylovulum sp.]|nr:SMI1/KNR4 family protein [Methylovulum sp.]